MPFLIGIDSPLINDSSTCVLPLTTIPSTANLFPGLTINISPFLTSSIDTFFSLLLINNIALFGVIVTSPFIVSLVFSLLIPSIYLPNLIKYKMIHTLSKYKFSTYSLFPFNIIIILKVLNIKLEITPKVTRVSILGDLYLIFLIPLMIISLPKYIKYKLNINRHTE